MSHKSANSQKTARPKNLLICHRNLFLPISSNFICRSHHFHKKSVLNRPKLDRHTHIIKCRELDYEVSMRYKNDKVNPLSHPIAPHTNYTETKKLPKEMFGNIHTRPMRYPQTTKDNCPQYQIILKCKITLNYQICQLPLK